MKLYITGDKHGVFADYAHHISLIPEITTNDIGIILGDSCLNYFCDDRDNQIKAFVNSLPITTFLIYGNHEERPENLPEKYHEKQFYGATAYVEDSFSNLVFAKDGEIYTFNNSSFLVIGGAFSPDKEYRLAYGYRWFKDEQPNRSIRERVIDSLNKNDWKVDYVLSHTCPYENMPTDMFLDDFKDIKIDHSTEEFLSSIKKNLSYGRWYAGHYHCDRSVGKHTFLFNDFYQIV